MSEKKESRGSRGTGPQLRLGAITMIAAAKYLVNALFLAAGLGMLAPATMAQVCTLDTLRTAGEAGDVYVGPSCDANGTYRACFYAEGANHPADGTQYALEVNGASTPVAFNAQVDSATSVLCGVDLPSGVGSVDVFAELEPGCNLLANDLYVAPDCPDTTTCAVNSIRLGGQVGDNYIGPTCNADGTYRTCYYLEGYAHPADESQYMLTIDGVPTPVVFSRQIDVQTTVMCVSDLPSEVGLVDVVAELQPSCGISSEDLYTAPVCPDTTVCSIDSVRLGGMPGDNYIGPTCNNDGTFRTCLYASGSNHPTTDAQYALELEFSPVEIDFSTRPNSSQTIVCATGLSTLPNPFDVSLELAPGCSSFVPDLFTGPDCLIEAASITACKYDSYGAPVPGWTMELAGTEEQSGPTADNGCITFTVNTGGVYTVSEAERAGWSPITPESGSYEVTVTGGEAYGPFDFTNFELPRITACKEDVFGKRLGGWTINLLDDAGQEIAEGITREEDGCVEFLAPEAGDYSLTEDQQEYWSVLRPESGVFAFSTTAGFARTYTFVNRLSIPVPATSLAGLLALLLLVAGIAYLGLRKQSA